MRSSNSKTSWLSTLLTVLLLTCLTSCCKRGQAQMTPPLVQRLPCLAMTDPMPPKPAGVKAKSCQYEYCLNKADAWRLKNYIAAWIRYGKTVEGRCRAPGEPVVMGEAR